LSEKEHTPRRDGEPVVHVDAEHGRVERAAVAGRPLATKWRNPTSVDTKKMAPAALENQRSVFTLQHSGTCSIAELAREDTIQGLAEAQHFAGRPASSTKPQPVPRMTGLYEFEMCSGGVTKCEHQGA